MSDDELAAFAAVGQELRLADPNTYGALIVAMYSPDGFAEDIVAVVRYRTWRRQGHRWGVVQRVGPVWSSTLGLEPADAARRAIVAAGKDPDALDAGGTDARTTDA